MSQRRNLLASSIGILSVSLLFSCTARKRNYGDSAGAGGQEASGGAADSGGRSATGGKAGAGTNATSGGTTTSTSGGMTSGGTTSSGTTSGGTTSGGTTSGGTTSGGTTAQRCSTDTDCSSPDAYTCKATCNGGICEVSAIETLGIGTCNGTCEDHPVTSFWGLDAQSAATVPYVAYAPPKDTLMPATVLIQKLRADGAPNGSPATYTFPDAQTQAGMLTSAVRGSKVALLWNATTIPTSGAPDLITQVTLTDVFGTPSTPVALTTSTVNTNSPDTPYSLFIYPYQSTAWIAAQYGRAGGLWQGFAGALDTLSRVTALTSSPVNGSISPQTASLLGSTLMVTGYSCSWYRITTCSPYLVVQRYKASDLSVLGSSISLSENAYNPLTATFWSPVLGKFGTRMAALWSESATGGALQLGRVLLNEDGSFANTRIVTPSTLIPKAFVETTTGAGLLVASQFDATNSTHTLVVQRMDSSFNLVGSPHQLASADAKDPAQVEAHLSSDGRVLISYRQTWSRHRIIRADLCN